MDCAAAGRGRKKGKAQIVRKRFLAQVQLLALPQVPTASPGDICLSFQANVCSNSAFLLEPPPAVKQFIS
jgi:hypothetical protein